LKFLMLIRHAESYRSHTIPQSLMDAMGEFVTDNMKGGVLKDTAGLKPTADGFRIRSKNGTLTATDGPFTETKEVIGGFALVEVNTPEEARDFANRFMDLHRIHWPAFEGECEVRPFEEP
jgi:hypothetical protein